MPKPSGCVLAFDFGKQRIGVAQGEMETAIAHPLCTIQGISNQDKFNQIGKLITEWQPKLLLVGLPKHMDGNEHEMTSACRQFARRLNGRFRLPIYLIDERLTSIQAEQMLQEAHTFGKKNKAALDCTAAMLFLQTFLNQGDAAVESTYTRHQQ